MAVKVHFMVTQLHGRRREAHQLYCGSHPDFAVGPLCQCCLLCGDAFSLVIFQSEKDMQIVPWLSYSVPSVLNLAGLSYTTFCSIYLYLMCVLVDPGRYV